MSNELMTFEETVTLAEHFSKSGYFEDTKELSKAVVKIVAGRELGIGPFAAMTGLFLDNNGKLGMYANLMAAMIKRHPEYSYRITDHSEASCSIEFKKGNDVLGVSTFTIKDAKQADLLTGSNKHSWTRYPRNMLFNRALSNGAKWHCPDLFAGSAAYTPEELNMAEEPEITVATPEPVVIEAEIQPAPDPTAREKWILAGIKQDNFPFDKSPIEQVKFVNDLIDAREGLDIGGPVTIKEVEELVGDK